jgi:excisionase family DNA binding protein
MSGLAQKGAVPGQSDSDCLPSVPCVAALIVVEFSSPSCPRMPPMATTTDQPGRVVLTADEVADMLGVTKAWVYTQSREGKIPTVRLGRYFRYRPEAIAEWLETQEA